MTEAADRQVNAEKPSEQATSLFQAEALAELTSSLSAGIGGAVAFALIAASKGKVLAAPGAMAAGGVTKFGVKSGLESAFVEEKDRTAGVADLAWGAVDGLAGVSASLAEQMASRAYLGMIAREALGSSISTTIKEQAGRQLIQANAVQGVKHALVRGMSGGAAGTFTWSVPHRVYENAGALSGDPASGVIRIGSEILCDTAGGAVFGGLISGGGSAVWRSPELLGMARSAISKSSDLKLRTLHLNDFHSQNDRLAAIKPVSDRLFNESKQNGIFAQMVSAGDLEGTNVQYISSKAGMVENSSLMKMGTRKFVPGNHTYDHGSGFNVDGYARTMKTLLDTHPDASLIATNLDLSAYPGYARIAKKFTIDTIAGPNGSQKVATLGLVTREGTKLGDVPGIGYLDAKNTAVDTMLELAEKQGVRKFVILSHLGLGEDQALAQALVADSRLATAGNLKVAAIIGGHTHDVTAVPIWVGRNGVSTGGLSTLKNMQTGYEIPIVQAGSNGNWLGQLDLAIRPDGAANRFKTLMRLHEIKPGMPKDLELDGYVRSQMDELAALRQVDYNTRLTGSLTATNLRRSETELGNMVSQAIDEQVAADAVLLHSGWLRTGLDTNVVDGKTLGAITRENLAGMFKSGGNAALEKTELHVYRVSGEELRNILEFSVRTMQRPKLPTLRERIGNLFTSDKLNPEVEDPGNFLQVAGIKYEFDLSKNPLTALKSGRSGTIGGDGSRIGSVAIRSGDAGYVPLDPSKEYSIATRQFIMDKWSRFGIFGDRAVEKTAVGKSAVDMVGDLIGNRQINPSMFSPQGRITDLTVRPFESTLKIGPSIVTAPAWQWSESRREKQSKL